MGQRCEHFSQIHTYAPRTEGCDECLKTGDTWVHLRTGLVCGHVGCCDQSKSRHATKHFHATAHAMMRSRQPGDAIGAYLDKRMFYAV